MAYRQEKKRIFGDILLYRDNMHLQLVLYALYVVRSYIFFVLFNRLSVLKTYNSLFRFGCSYFHLISFSFNTVI